MLQEHGGREGIDVAFAASGRAAHFTNGALRRGRRVSLVYETHGQAGPFLELGGNVARLESAWGVVAVFIKGQANDEAFDLERGPSTDHFGDRRPLAAPALDESGRRRNGPGRIADGEPDASVSVVDRQ